MQTFFENIETIHAFTLSLNYHQPSLQCEHCSKNDQFISHGFIYKQLSCHLRQKVGKRIFCSNRNGHTGCGRTFRLYVMARIPRLQYSTAHLFIFLCSLLAHQSIQQAYETATGTEEPRNAWRWLDKLHHKLIDYRCRLKCRSKFLYTAFASGTKRLHLLLPTITRLFSLLGDNPCDHYQQAFQKAFI